jgi:hypothetical protein
MNMITSKDSFDRRRFLKRLVMAAIGLTFLPLVCKAEASPTEFPGSKDSAARGLKITDLARPRKTYIPSGGVYDHNLQQMTGDHVLLARTATGGGEDDCCQSTTFWDGERS